MDSSTQDYLDKIEKLKVRVDELQEENKKLKVGSQVIQIRYDRLLEFSKFFRIKCLSLLGWISKCLSTQLGYTTLTHADRKGQVLMIVKIIETDLDKIRNEYTLPLSEDSQIWQLKQELNDPDGSDIFM